MVSGASKPGGSQPPLPDEPGASLLEKLNGVVVVMYFATDKLIHTRTEHIENGRCVAGSRLIESTIFTASAQHQTGS